jgi:Holliday junction resolvase RusA-like endonuclease
MLARVEFTIPGRPTAWARTGSNVGADGRGARKFTPHKQRKAMQTVQRTWNAYALRERRNAPLMGPLRLEVLCVYAIPVSWPKDKREAAARGLVWKTSVPDWDNLGKLVGDALNRHAYDDDATIAIATVAKRYGSPERTVIRLTELEPWQDALVRIGLPEKPQGALPL